MIAHRRDGFQAHVAGTLDDPFIVLLEQERPDQSCHRGLVGEYADHIAAALNLAVEPFERIGAVQLDPVLCGETHVGQHVRLGVVHQGRQLGHARAQLVGDMAPLLARGLGVVLGEGGADPGRDDAALRPAGVRHGVAHEVHAAALPGGAEHLGNGGLQSLVRVRYDQLDAAQAAAGQAAQELDPERLGLAMADGHAEHLASAIGVDADGDDDGDRDDVMVSSDFDVGGVKPDVGPIAFDGAAQEGLHAFVDLAAQARDLALADTLHAEGFHQIIH